MKVIVFGYNAFAAQNVNDIKADIVKQLRDNTGLLLIDNRMDLKGVLEMNAKDLKQFGVLISTQGERENH